MTAEKLLKDLEQLDVDVAVDGDHLTIDAPHGVLTEDLQRKLRKRKPELIRLIRRQASQRPVPTPAEVEEMLLSEFAQAGLIVRLGTAEEWGADVLVVSDDVPEAEVRDQGLTVYWAAELRKLHRLRPKPHELRLLHDVKTIFGQTILSVTPRLATSGTETDTPTGEDPPLARIPGDGRRRPGRCTR